MRIRDVISVFVIGCALGAAPTTSPSTQPSTQPAFDLRVTMALIDAAGGVYTSIHEAVEKGDLDTAKQLTEDLLKQSEDFRSAVRGTPLVVPVNMGLTQLNRLRDALAEKDADKAKTIMAGLDRIGSGITDALDAMQSVVPPTTRPARGDR